MQPEAVPVPDASERIPLSDHRISHPAHPDRPESAGHHHLKTEHLRPMTLLRKPDWKYRMSMYLYHPSIHRHHPLTHRRRHLHPQCHPAALSPGPSIHHHRYQYPD